MSLTIILGDVLPVFLLRGALVLAVAYAVAFAMRRKGGSALRTMWCVAWIVLFALPVSFHFQGWNLPVMALAPREIPEPPPPIAHGDVIVAVPSIADPMSAASLPDSPKARNPAQVFALVWMAGAAAGLLYLLTGRLILFNLQLGKVPLDDPWKRSTAKVATGLGLRRVRVSFAKKVRVPMTTGVFRPQVLIPVAARGFEAGHREAVLRHELTHVRGRDPLLLLLASAATAVHWMNPMAWLALRSLRFAQERVCDDAVLRGDSGAEDYAGLLLDVARSGGNRFPASAGIALLMAPRNKAPLQRRITLILDKTMKRKTLTRSQTLLMTASVLAVSLPAALIGVNEPSPPGKTAATGEPAGPVEPAEFADPTDEAIVPSEYPRTAYLETKLKETVIPTLAFDDAPLAEVIEFLRQRSIDLDPFEGDTNKKGINFVLLKQANSAGRLRSSKRVKHSLEKLADEVAIYRALMLEMAEKYALLDDQEAVDTEIYKLTRNRVTEAKLEIKKLENRVRQLQDLAGENLIEWLVTLESDSMIAKLHEKYNDAIIEMRTLNETLSAGHPKAEAQSVKVAHLKHLLEQLVETYKHTLGTKLRIEQQILKGVMKHEDTVADTMLGRKRKSIEYAEAKREYEMRLELLQSLRRAELTREAMAGEEEPATCTLNLKNIPLGDALKYATLQTGMRMLVQPHAVVIGTPEEIAALK